MKTIKFKKLHPDALLPTRVNVTDSGLDLYSVEDHVIINPGEQKVIGTGLAMALPKFDSSTGFPFLLEAQIRPRSGLAAKYGITVVNSPGTVDNGYRGEIKVILRNEGVDPFYVTQGLKIAQMVICPVVNYPISLVEDLDETSRGKDGFGSSGD
jgi:dUTP pyrophosphatase